MKHPTYRKLTKAHEKKKKDAFNHVSEFKTRFFGKRGRQGTNYSSK